MLFLKRQKELERQIGEYCEQVLLCVQSMRNTFEKYQDPATPQDGFLQQASAEAHRHESKADDLRRDIEVRMYKKSMFPESRGDILGLLEALDKVANQAESAVRMMRTHHVTVPIEYRSDLLRLADIALRSVETLLAGVGKLFTDFANAAASAGKVDELESLADQLEATLTERIFGSSLDGFQKLLVGEVVKKTSGVCDRAEDAADRVGLIVAKRGL
jgi:uncharacterized protein